MARACAGQAPIAARATEVVHLGRGVAVRVEAPELHLLRARMADGWEGRLTPQDVRPWRRPHVTVQNKVEPAAARALFAELRAGFDPFAITVEGVDTWRYRGGPWEALAPVRFTGG